MVRSHTTPQEELPRVGEMVQVASTHTHNAWTHNRVPLTPLSTNSRRFPLLLMVLSALRRSER